LEEFAAVAFKSCASAGFAARLTDNRSQPFSPARNECHPAGCGFFKE
jgi:hypothetical protein